jgi:uncharacterized protein YjbJ (UPF0337 family)
VSPRRSGRAPLVLRRSTDGVEAIERSLDDKEKTMDNKDQAKGKIKQAMGVLTGNKDLKRHGKADERAGNVKRVVDDAKDEIEGLVDSAKDKLTKH